MKKILLFTLFTVVVSGVTALTVVKLTNRNTVSYSKNYDGLPAQKVNLSGQTFPDFTYAAETAVKAVVHVKVVSKSLQNQYSLFDLFFGNAPERVPREQTGVGSGVIIAPDGYIVTNNHVIDGAEDITVTLDNNVSYKAKLVGRDNVTDIALLKIDENNLPCLTFGSSDSLRLGEWVLAIGNPYNLRSTVTAGIVSAKARSIPEPDGQFRIESFIQTDAAVNPGNSGGALVNTKGELVGINTAIATRTGSYAGYSFAVPSTIVKKIVEDFIRFGSVKRAMLGISMQDINSDLAKEKNIKQLYGVYVAEVVKGGAAEKAGIRPNDIIISINDIKTNSAPEVQEQISRFSPKQAVKVTFVRDGKENTVNVVLQGSTEGNLTASVTNTVDVFGSSVRNADASLLKRYGVKYGVEVVSIGDGKFKKAGIKTGFVITHINQSPVKNTSDLLDAIKMSSRSVLIEGVYADGSVMYYGMGV